MLTQKGHKSSHQRTLNKESLPYIKEMTLFLCTIYSNNQPILPAVVNMATPHFSEWSARRNWTGQNILRLQTVECWGNIPTNHQQILKKWCWSLLNPVCLNPKHVSILYLGLVQIPVSMYQTVVTSLAQGNRPVQVAMAPVATRIDNTVTLDGQAVEVVTLEQWH